MNKDMDLNSGKEVIEHSVMEKYSEQESKNSLVDKSEFRGKDITQMNSEDLKAHFLSSGAEFSSKMEENFRNCLFIAPSKQGTENLDTVVQMMASFDGYKMHRTVGCSRRIYHIYVKYEAEYIAIAARDLFRSKHYHAEIVDDMLRLWYAFEKGSGQAVYPTIAWLTNANGKYLTSESATRVLNKFGNPEIDSVMDKSVKINFASLAEAFGACISLGPWFYNNMLKDSNYHSLKIVLSPHSSKIMRMCNMTSVSRELDYFAQNDPAYSKTELSPHSKKVELDQPIQTLDGSELRKTIKTVSNYSEKLPYRMVQRNRNGGRFFKRSYGSHQFPYNQNKSKVF